VPSGALTNPQPGREAQIYGLWESVGPLSRQLSPMEIFTNRPMSTAQLTNLGYDRNAIRAALSRGDLRRLARGVYVKSSVPDNSLTRASALSLVLPHSSAAVRLSAAWIHEIPGIEVDVDDIFAKPEFALVGRDTHIGRVGVVQHRYQIAPRDLIRIGDLRLTTFDRTAFDLARTNDASKALGYLDMCASTGRLDLDQVLRIRRQSRGFRFVGTIDLVLPMVDKGSQSMGESRTRLKIIRAGLPIPATQCQVFIPSTGQTYYLDLGWQRVKVGVEFDGAADHSSPGQVAHDSRRRTLIEALGWKIFVIRSEDLRSEKWIGDVRSAIQSRLPRALALLGA
jgi:hypothetical protein